MARNLHVQINGQSYIITNLPDEAPADAAADQPAMTRAGILAEAARITTADRNLQYGRPEDLFARIAAYWSHHLGHAVTATDVAVMMTLLKIARIEANPCHADSWIDAAGYIACGAETVAAGAEG